MKTTSSTPLLPPDEKFWQRYSSHHELPLSGMTSLFVHAVVVGGLLIVGYLVSLRWHSESNQPPRMDMIMIEGGGDGFEGLGGPEGLPGASAVRTELAPQAAPPPTVPKVAEQALDLDDAPSVELFVPAAEPKVNPEAANLLSQLEKLTQEASAQAATKNIGTNNPKGVGGKGGIGDGPGPGKGKKGTGPGMGGVGGKLSKAQILAWRWRFDLTGDAKVHADKLAAVGVTLAVPDHKGDYWLIRDLTKRPVEIRKEGLDQFKDAVKWYNTKKESVFGLATELGLPFIPQHVVLLLPKEREEQMAGAEAVFAKQQRRDLGRVQATWFDFRIRGNASEPAVLRME